MVVPTGNTVFIRSIAPGEQAGCPRNSVLVGINACVMPDLTMAQITGVKITRLARESHINSVEEGNRGRQKHYWLVRQRINETKDNGNDIRATEQGNISITPLYFNRSDKPPQQILDNLCSDLLPQLRNSYKEPINP